MFQLPQNGIFLESRNWKTCLCLRDAHRSRDQQQLYGAIPLNFYIFFFMQRIDYIFIKKRDFNEICTMFLG